MSGLRDHLQRVYDERGELTPRLVVDEARDENHPLHARFEWDDAVAGERYREVQAGRLIRSVEITYREATDKKPEGRIRYWQSVRTERGDTYKPAEEIAHDPVLTPMLEMQMRRDIKALKDRYEGFKEFAQIVRDELGTEAS